VKPARIKAEDAHKRLKLHSSSVKGALSRPEVTHITVKVAHIVTKLVRIVTKVGVSSVKALSSRVKVGRKRVKVVF
jgi:hypothetical protein